MADTETDKPAPAPAPRIAAAVPRNRVAQVTEAIAAEHAAQDARTQRQHKTPRRQAAPAQAAAPNDPLRPLKVTGSFIGGTVKGGLNGIGKGAGYGFWVGAAVGVLGCFAVGLGGGGLLIMAAGLVGTTMAGMALGGGVGLLTGGANGVRKEMAADKQHDSKTAGRQPQQGRGPVRNYTDHQAAQRYVGQVNFDRYRQQDAENDRDQATYWQDRVSAERDGWGMGRGS